MRCAIFTFIILIIPSIAFSHTVIVPDDYPTIQDAIDAVVDGDTVLVKPGTYVEHIDFKGKAITLKSDQGADVTIIDGNETESVVTCMSGEGADSVLDGFTITNGWPSNGGGMYNFLSNPTVTNCTFYGNCGDNHGGGMCNWESSPTVTHCIFTNNWASEGGGMFNEDSSPTVTHCTFTENYACRGGGVYNLNSSPTLTQCTFFKNIASGPVGAAPYGGGMFEEQSNTSVVNCTFIENYSIPSDPGNPSYGDGMYITFGSFPTVINTILWNNWEWGGLVCIGDSSYPSTLTISYSDVSGACYVQPGCTLDWGDGMIDADPRLVDPVNGDLHLTWLSPCINRGINDGAPLEDIDGDPRPYMGTVDMGADEFVGIHPLAADGFSVSEVTGGTVNFTLTGGLDNNGRTYIVLGGVTGTAPGIPLPGGLATLPVNWDAFTDFVLALIYTSVFSNFLGTLDATGTASVQLNVPPVPGFAGLEMYYAYALNNPWDFVSNPLAVEIVQ